MRREELDVHLSIIEAMAVAINFEATLLAVAALMGDVVNLTELSATFRAASANILQSVAVLRERAEG